MSERAKPQNVRPGRPLLVLGLSAIVGLVAFLAYSSIEKYLDARAIVVAQTTEDARLFREYADRTFQTVDMALEEVIRNVGVRPWPEVAVSRDDWNRLRKIADAVPPMRSIWLVDQNGYMRLFSGRWPTPSLDVIDREYFTAHGFGTPPRLHFGAQLPGRYTGQVFVPVSRPILIGPDGFRGIVAAAVEPNYYLPFLESDHACTACSVGIYRMDGTPLVVAGTDGQAVAPAAVRDLFQGLTRAGTRYEVREHEPIPGAGPSIVSATISNRYDLGVVVAAPMSVVSALWWDRSDGMLLVGIPCVLALGFLLRRAHLASQIQEQARRAAEVAQRREKKLREQAAQANRAKSEFLALMSHELRTPLNAVIGFSEMIAKETLGPNNPKYRQYASDIYDSGQHLLSLINDILDLSKIEAQRWELHEERLDLGSVFQAVERLSKVRAQERGVNLRIAHTDLRVIADNRALKQILVNLVTNAIKYTDPGGTVALEVAHDDAWLYLCVADTGRGMTPAELERAVQLFGQGQSHLTRESEGTGLGLNICRALAELHGGGLDMASTPGKGTRATVRLPVGRLAAASGSDAPVTPVNRVAV